ncbi:hypothetical protein [Rhodococcus sovatensis]|uniref:Uncharacterized protein n=1 Tax=Rhodococcus sovatensis TaxID=1805840 RepID=A0ABZ2PKD9_9NOCA
MAPRPIRPAAQYRYAWSLFVEWCSVAEYVPLSTTPAVLADLLNDNSAGDAVLKRRVSAINRHYLDAGHTPDGRVTWFRGGSTCRELT